MIDRVHFPDTPFPIRDHLILLARYGSAAYDLVTEQSSGDQDLMGVVAPPRKYYLGLSHWENATAIKGTWDVTLHELRKFVSLLCKQNPSVLGLLWTPDEHVLVRSMEATVLIENRDLFKHELYARDAFCGYARSQLTRMTAFDRDTMQVIADIEQRLLDHGIHVGHAAEGKLKSEAPDIQPWIDRYVEMRRKHHKAYMGAKRWALVQKIGYDAKNAGHLIRLLHMGYEYLTTGQVNVRRTWDRDMLIEIKLGEWPIGRVKAYAQEWFDKVEQAKSVLPLSINKLEVEGLLVSLLESRLEIR